MRVLLGRREELRAPAPPFVVDRVDVGDADVQERARPVRVSRRLEDDLRLVVGGSASDVDDDPAVGELDGRGLALEDDLSAEYVPIEGGLARDVTARDEVRQDEPFARRREVFLPWVHVTSAAERPSRKRGNIRPLERLTAGVERASFTQSGRWFERPQGLEAPAMWRDGFTRNSQNRHAPGVLRLLKVGPFPPLGHIGRRGPPP